MAGAASGAWGLALAGVHLPIEVSVSKQALWPGAAAIGTAARAWALPQDTVERAELGLIKKRRSHLALQRL